MKLEHIVITVITFFLELFFLGYAYFTFLIYLESKMLLLLFYSFVCLCCSIGLGVAYFHRLKEIKGGEEDEAHKY